MRILRLDEPHVLKLRLIGVLDRTTCHRAEAEISEALVAVGQRRLILDLGDLQVAGQEAAELIRSLPLRGVELSSVAKPISRLLDASAQYECRKHCNPLQQLLFRAAQAARSGPAALRSAMCDMLRSVLPASFVIRYLRTSRLCRAD